GTKRGHREGEKRTPATDLEEPKGASKAVAAKLTKNTTLRFQGDGAEELWHGVATVLGPNCPVPPRSWTAGRAAHAHRAALSRPRSESTIRLGRLALAAPEKGRVEAAMFVCVSKGIKT